MDGGDGSNDQQEPFKQDRNFASNNFSEPILNNIRKRQTLEPTKQHRRRSQTKTSPLQHHRIHLLLPQKVGNRTRSRNTSTISGGRRKQTITEKKFSDSVVVVAPYLPPPSRTKQGVFQLAFQKQGSKQLYHPLRKDDKRCPKNKKDVER
jgi:hypothetical protein